MLGTKLRDRYYIFKELGVGGFGQTFLAKDCDFPGMPWCVVKQLKPQVNEAWMLQTARRLFQDEASVLAQIGSHSQIPQLMAHFEEDHQFYLVQEFIDGTLLSKEFKGNKTWTQQDAIAFLQNVLGVLKFIHSHKVIHRDLKPENIIRRNSDRKLVLIDFGSVKKVTTFQEEEEDDEYSVVIGSPSYMAPEQQRGQPCYSSDIYALGKIVIQGLTGISPKKLAEDPTVWRNFANIDEALANILTQMIQLSSHHRYQSIEVIMDDLNLQGSETSVSSSSISFQGENHYTLNNIVHHLKQHPEITRIKKMLFCACKHRWENSSQVLIKYRTKSLLQELYQREPDFSRFEQAINGVVNTLNKKHKYQNVANIILEQVQYLYNNSHAVIGDDSQNSEGIPSQFTAIKSGGYANTNLLHDRTKIKSHAEVSQQQNHSHHQEEIESNLPADNNPNSNDSPEQSIPPKNYCNIFDLRYEVTRYTTPLRIKILLFSTLYYKIGFNEQDWSMMISHQLDSLLKELIKMFPTLAELETRLYATAKHFEEKEGLTQTVGAIIQSIRPFYENGQPELTH